MSEAQTPQTAGQHGAHAEEYSMPAKDRLFAHTYDGIQEYDNPLPGWWKNLFWATFLFAVGYFIYYPLTHRGASIHEIHAQEMKELRALRASFGLTPAQVKQMAKKILQSKTALKEAIAAGSKLFHGKGICFTCHRADGGGLIGPNLTDDYWINPVGLKRKEGPTVSDIFNIITNGGRDGKGMPKHKKKFSPKERLQLAIYVASLRGKTPKVAKKPIKEARKYNYTTSPIAP